MYQAADILEKYGIGSETDVSELEQHDSSMQGLAVLSIEQALACKEELWQVLFYWLSLTFQNRRWSRHTLTPLLLLQSYLKETIEGNKGAQLARLLQPIIDYS